MDIQSLSICPHLKGGDSGARCLAADRLINEMKEINIKICMSRRHEACSIYFCSLQNFGDDIISKRNTCAEI